MWINVFRRYSANGAPVVLLIHPNRGYKLDAEKEFVEPLPVELATFDATWSDGRVRLTWRTASETNNAGFRVQRRAEDESWSTLGFVEGQGTTADPSSYRFTDENLPFASDSLTYRLQQVDADGSTALSEAVTLSRTPPQDLRLRAPFPNPVRNRATVRYVLPARREVVLSIHDVVGRRVATVERGVVEPGRGQMQLDVSGLSSGVYFVRLQAGTATRTRKLTVVK